MCGRYVVAYDPHTLVSGFTLQRIQPFPKRWNVAPTTPVPVVYETRDGERICETMRWGLIPSWAKDPAIGNKLNNARSDGVFDKPSFRQAVRKRRCLLPASGFYEWQAPGPGEKLKQPWYFSPQGEPFFAMAGLFEAWRPDETAPWLLSCCIITTDANTLLAPVHDRMPVIVPREHWAAWLARAQTERPAIEPLLAPFDPALMQAWPVSRNVSRSSSDGEELIRPMTARDP